jgi:geranylgeranyl diphosphate synthase type I
MDSLSRFFLNKKILVTERLNQLSLILEKESLKKSFLSNSAFNKLFKLAGSGKGIRGGLVFLSAQMYGYNNKKFLIDVAAGLELIHTSLLIHDDIMDNDWLRRGQPSVFAQYYDFARKKNFFNPLLFGQSVAISIGDIGFFIGLKLINNSKIIAKICQELTFVGKGQIDDVYFGNLKKNPTEKQIINLYRNKTARYTFSLPLAIGAIIANQKKSEIEKLEKLGENLGIAFQIKDDLLVFSKNKDKPILSDLKNNKKTLWRILLYQKATAEEKKFIDFIFSGKAIAKKDLLKLRRLFTYYKIQNLLSKYFKKNENFKIINFLKINKHYRKLLIKLNEIK